jgi:hypothetical protein
VVITGPAASGKSHLVGLLAERWILANYCVLLLDPEGDHIHLQQLSQVQVVDAAQHLPEPADLVSALRPQISIVVDISGLAEEGKSDYMHRLRLTAEAYREQLGAEEHAHWTRRGGYVLSSFTPAALPAKEVDNSDVVLTLMPPATPADIDPGRSATVQFGSGPARLFTIADRLTTHVRHGHKYADVSLPRDRQFYFHSAVGIPVPPAATLHDFCTAIAHLDQRVLEYHLERGDFSRWLDGTITDRDLAGRVAAWEDELEAHRAADLERIRYKLVRAVEERYLPAPELR